MEKGSPKNVGKYEIIRLVGKGGMGEIFLANDPVFGREIALKRILDRLLRYPTIKKRFLSEARIAARLAHPSIIPIYALHEDKEQIYYTMPYVEGETLKHIIKKTREKEKANEPPHPIGSSIPSLIRIFLSVCQAMHYTHTKKFLHRDLKPENIIVGKFGEVMIVDWGIAVQMENAKEEEEPIEASSPRDLTLPGKVVGTVGYMAPERAMGHSATIKTDIYSLGVILYQLMTFRLPFIRPSLKDFRKKMRLEKWTEPQEVAAHRDIPSQLSRIAKRCLNPDPALRYDSVHEVIEQLENYIEGCPEWIPTSPLNLSKTEDWEFQENIMLTKRLAVCRFSNLMEWFMLMISKESYSGNMRIEIPLTLGEESQGIGVLFCVPEPRDRKELEEGYCLWIGTPKNPSSTLFRSNVEVMHIPDCILKPERHHVIAIEKVENNVRLLIDGNFISSYVSYIPLVGGHLGLLLRDTHFKMEEVKLFFGSQSVMVNCLSIPDAFMINRDYKKALTEYRRIAHSFKGRAEQREALFRAGITMLEEAKRSREASKKDELLANALDEFEKLRKTPGAPLEYLGKSLVYQTGNDLEEEIKCLELGIRKYLKHPLLSLVKEHVGFRLHEISRRDRWGAYSFLLLALRHVPHIFQAKETKELVNHLTREWELLSFIHPFETFSSDAVYHLHLVIQLAFWLSKPIVLYEVSQNIPSGAPEKYPLIDNLLFSLLEMGYPQLVDYILTKKVETVGIESKTLKTDFEIATQSEEDPIEDCLNRFLDVAPNRLSARKSRILKFLLEKGLYGKKGEELLPFLERISTFDVVEIDLQPIKIWAHLVAHRDAKELFPKDAIGVDSPYGPLYACFLAREGGEEKVLDHFESILETRYPPSNSLLGHFLKGNLKLKSPWWENAFLWEKIQLLRQLDLYYFCLNKREKGAQFEQMIKEEKEKYHIPLNFM